MMINLIENGMIKLYGIEIREETQLMIFSAAMFHSCPDFFNDVYTELNTFTAAA